MVMLCVRSLLLRSAILLVSLVATFRTPIWAQPNLLVNGSFEAGPEPGAFITLATGATSIPGWTVTRATIDYIGSYFPSADGHRHIDLDGTPGSGGMQQTFPTVAGQRYRVTFDLAGNPEGPPTVKTMRVEAAGQSQVFSHDASLNWSHEAWEFTATGPTTTIEFYSLDPEGGYCGPLLDNVSVIGLGTGKAVVSQRVKLTAKLTLTVLPSELEPEDTTEVVLGAALQGNTRPGTNTFDFSLISVDGVVERFRSASRGDTALLKVTSNKANNEYVLYDGSEELASISPGVYKIEAQVTQSNSVVVKSNVGGLTLHPKPLIKAWDPQTHGSGTSFTQLTALDRVVLYQKFRVAVEDSPYRKENPADITVALKSTEDKLDHSLNRAESSGPGLASYDDMRTEPVQAVRYTPSTIVEHALEHIKVTPKGDTINISYRSASVPLKVLPDKCAEESDRLREIMLDYKAMYDALLQSIKLSTKTHELYQSRSELLTRALALQDPENVPCYVRLTTGKAYFELIQKSFDELGQKRLRYLPHEQLPERMRGMHVPVAFNQEETAVIAAIKKANQIAMDQVAQVLTGIGQMPFDFVEAIPSMLASPVYSGYTLLFGRQLDGEWASGRQRFFAGIDVALSLIPVATSVIKFTRPTLYERALARLHGTASTRVLLADEELHGALWPELQQKINRRQNAIAAWDKIIVHAEEELAQLPNKQSALTTKLSQLKNDLSTIDTQSPAAQRIASNRKKINDIQSKFRAKKTGPTAAQQAKIKQRMQRITADTELLERQKADLEKQIASTEDKQQQLATAKEAAEQRIKDSKAAIARGRKQIADWQGQTARGKYSPAERKRIARRSKLQGNEGEDIAFEALSRDGFVRQTEPGGRLPNEMKNWQELGEVVDLFGKTPADVAEFLQMDVSECEALMSKTTVPDPAKLEQAKDLIRQWQKIGVPYHPGGSIGPDGLFWNPQTNNFRLVEVKTGSAELGATQLTNKGIERWIDLMKNPANKLYRPSSAEALNVAYRSGRLERMVIRVGKDGAIVESYLIDALGNKVPVK